MYHSITFGDKNTWDDWHLIPTSRPVVAMPSVNENLIEIPGSNGSIDLTESLTGYPTFQDRSGSWDFIVANDYGDWVGRYQEITEYLHGRRMRCYLEDDPNYYYEGRFAVSWRSGNDWSTLQISYKVAPFKKSNWSTQEDWLWDPFNFETGFIDTAKDIEVDGSLEVLVRGGSDHSPVTIIAEIEDGDSLSLSVGGKTYAIENGTHVIPGLDLTNKVHTLTFTGNGTVTINYRSGTL